MVNPGASPKDILITTYPESGSRNVGDGLITESAMQLVRHRLPNYTPEIIFRMGSLDDCSAEEVASILAPGFSVNEGTYPLLYALYSDISRLKGFFPVGCSFQHPEASPAIYNNFTYSEATLAFLRRVEENTGPIPCRDAGIVNILQRHGIRSCYMGDLALYDRAYLFKTFVAPRCISSVAFTVQHNAKYKRQSFLVLNAIRRIFPKAALYVVHQSKVNRYSQKIAEYAVGLGYVEKDLSGAVENLAFYDDIDLHVGYRLHGHISFLRRRKPSFLIAEDSRSFGIINTPGLCVGGIPALDNSGEVDGELHKKLSVMIKQELSNGFRSFYPVFKFIDESYVNSVVPYFDGFARERGWKISPLVAVAERVVNQFKLRFCHAVWPAFPLLAGVLERGARKMQRKLRRQSA